MQWQSVRFISCLLYVAVMMYN